MIHLDGTVTPVASFNPDDPSEDVINARHPPDADEPAGPDEPDPSAPPAPGPTDPGPPPPPPSEVPVPGNPRGPDAPQPPSTTLGSRSPANRCPTLWPGPNLHHEYDGAHQHVVQLVDELIDDQPRGVAAASTTSSTTSTTSAATATRHRGPQLAVRGERSGPDFDLVAVTLTDWSDPSGVPTVRLHIVFRWFCPAEGEVTGSEQQTGDQDPFIANAFGSGLESFASWINGDTGGGSPYVEVP